MSFSTNLKSVDETAVGRNWSPKRVRKLVTEGLPFVQIGRQKFINSDTLDQYLKERERSVVRSAPPAKNTEACHHADDRSA